MNASERHRKFRATPRGRYWHQKMRARERGIPWRITFDEWWAIWEASGVWSLRGNRKGQYVMSRRADAGAYEPGNVEIKLFELNAAEVYANRTRPVTPEERAAVEDF